VYKAAQSCAGRFRRYVVAADETELLLFRRSAFSPEKFLTTTRERSSRRELALCFVRKEIFFCRKIARQKTRG